MGAINSAIQTRSVSLTLARLPTVNTGSWTDVAGLFARAATFFCPARRLRLRQLPCLLPREEVRQLTHTELEAAQDHRFRLIFVFRTLEEVPFARIRALMVAREQSVKATPIVVSPLALPRPRNLPCPLPLEEVRQLTHTEQVAVQEHRFRLIFVPRTLEEGLIARIGALMVAREQSVKATPIVVSPLALRTFRVVSYLSLEILEKLHPGLEPLALS